MSEPSGKYHPVSRFRRLVIDLMHFSAKVPSATVERRMDLARLVEVRQRTSGPHSWSAIFTKAYAAVAARTAILRTSYLTFPWPRFYEHPINIASINVDRFLPDERIVLYALIPSPEALTLGELDSALHRYKEEPVENLPSHRRAVRMSWTPWPFRRLAWWAALNVLGPTRCRYFGTFAVSSVGSLGAGILHLMPLLTSQIHYGMFDSAGQVEMRLSFDHRVLDGATAAQALADMETELLGDVGE